MRATTNASRARGFDGFTRVARKSRLRMGWGKHVCKGWRGEGCGKRVMMRGTRVRGKNKTGEERRGEEREREREGESEKRVKGGRMHARCSTVLSLSRAASCACPAPGPTLPFHIHYTCTRTFSGECDRKIDDVISRFLCRHRRLRHYSF